MDKIKSAFRRVYHNLFLINDSPQRVALGFGIGVFTGMLPGMGPVASVVLAAAARANKAAAFAASILTNTWISLIALAMATKIGGWIFRIPWETIRDDWRALLDDFQWSAFFSEAFYSIVLPIAVGYVIISIAAFIAAYLIALSILKLKKRA